FRVDIPYTQVKEPERVMRIEEEILHKIEAVPGVSSVSLSMSVPMDGNDTTSPAFAKDRTYSQGELPLQRSRFVAPGFFKTLGTPLVAGRDLTWSDIYNKVPVAIVSDRMAREYWRDPANALAHEDSRSMARPSFTLTVLGIAGGMALLRGVVGLYGAIAYSVSARTHEMGMRVAVGAESEDVLKMVVQGGFKLAGLGVVVG